MLSYRAAAEPSPSRGVGRGAAGVKDVDIQLLSLRNVSINLYDLQNIPTKLR